VTALIPIIIGPIYEDEEQPPQANAEFLKLSICWTGNNYDLIPQHTIDLHVRSEGRHNRDPYAPRPEAMA